LGKLQARFGDFPVKGDCTEAQGDNGIVTRRNHPLVSRPRLAALLIGAKQTPIADRVSILLAEVLGVFDDLSCVASATGVIRLPAAARGAASTAVAVAMAVPIAITIAVAIPSGGAVAVAGGAPRMIAVPVSVPQVFPLT